MLRIILLTTLRNFFKHKNINLINLLGLVIGISSFLFTLHYLLYEFSFDSFIPSHQQVYRVNLDIEKDGEKIYHGSKTPRGLYDALRNDIPEVKANGIAYFEKCLVNFENTSYADQDVLWVDEGFEKVFPLEMIQGIADYSRPRTGIISETSARALFGNDDPIGKIMGVNQGMPIEITGVFKDIPANSHLKASYFASIDTWVEMDAIQDMGDWLWLGWWNYIRLDDGYTPEQAEHTINGLLSTHMSYLEDDNRSGRFTLQPLKNLHFSSALEGTMGASSNYNSLVNLIIIALVTLIVAWINYVNLSTAHAESRSLQIGMRKLFGASKWHQWHQTLSESILINLLAVLISFAIFFIFLQPFANTFNIPLGQSHIPYSQLFLIIAVTLILGIFFSSLYHGVHLAKTSFIDRKNPGSSSHFKKGLVIIQMAVSVTFLISTILVYQQINYMKNKDLGIALNDVLILNAPASLNADGEKRQRFEGFKSELLGYADFESMNFNLFTPGQTPYYGFQEFTNPLTQTHPDVQFFENNAGDGLIATYNMKLLAGKEFSNHAPGNINKVILNRLSMDLLGISHPDVAIGQNIYRKNDQATPLEIIGVVENFHNESLQKAIYPMVWTNFFPGEFGYFSVSINTRNVQGAIDILNRLWKKHYPQDVLSFEFADVLFDTQYSSVNRISKFYLWLTLLSIGIATLGLYALTVFYLEKRIKEIGVRKVNGARVGELLLMLNKSFSIWVVIAFILACPVAWWATSRWLTNFAYRIEISWLVFMTGGIITLLITIITVSTKSWRAARRNPVEALRYE